MKIIKKNNPVNRTQTRVIEPKATLLTNNDLRQLVKDGRNIEIAAKIICNQENGWVLTKDPAMPTRPVILINGEKFLIRARTAKGFDLAPAKMKGTQRTRDEDDAKIFSQNNKFILIDATTGTIRYKLIHNPGVTFIKDLDAI